MHKQLLLCALLFLCAFSAYAQDNCGWTDTTETHYDYPSESASCTSDVDNYIPAASDSILTVRIAVVIARDQNGDSPFTDNFIQDSTDFSNAISFMNGNCFSNIPAPAVANPNPTSTVTDTRIRFVLSRFFYRTADSAGNNVVDYDLVKSSLPEEVRNSHFIVNYSSESYNHKTPKTVPWGIAQGSKYVTMWEHTTAWGIALLAHEIGHCLSLSHTFHTNSFGDGDGIDDTPLDIFAKSAAVCAPAPVNCVCPPTTPYPGNVCPDNFMGYGQQNWWSPRQVARMRRHLFRVVPEVLQTNLPTSAPATFRTITANETWTDQRFVYQNIRIQSGAVLTLDGAVVIMGKDAIIEVEPNAELVINCSSISSGNGYWGGIRLLGDNTQPQTSQYQSTLRMHRSKLSKATDAIMNGGIYSCAVNPSGGIIEVDSSLFYNNLRDVALVKYDRSAQIGHWLADWVGYKASFRHSDFLKDENLTIGSGTYRGASVSLWGVHGVTFDHCDLDQKSIANLQNPLYPQDGIFMLDASAHISHSSVQHFKYGIHALSTKPTLKGSTIAHSVFRANRYSVYLAGSRLNKVYKNDFYLPKDVPGTTSNGIDVPYGLYLNQAGTFSAEENLFINTISPYRNFSTAPAATHIALVVNDNGDFSDILYKNRFSSVLGIEALGQNRDGSGNVGLQCKCNEFTHPKTDIYVRGTLNNSLDGVRPNQGNLVPPILAEQEDMAGNLFSSDTTNHQWDFYNEFTPNINYHHHDKTSNTRIEATPNQGVLNFDNSNLDYNTNSCPTQLLIRPEGDTLAEIDYPFSAAEIDFADYSGKSDSLQGLLGNLIDGGNTWQLQAEIYFTPQHEYYELYLDMMNEAPYLSRSVLSDLIALDGFDDMMLRNVLVAHPQSAKDAALMDQLATDHPAMPQYMVDDIMAGQNHFGTKEVMEGTLSACRQKQFRAAHRLLDIYTGDPAYSEEALTAVRSIFDAMPFAGFQYMRVQMELDLGNIGTAQNVLDNIPNVVSMNDDEIARHNQVVGYFDIQVDMAENGLQWCDVDETVLSGLQGMSGVNHAAGAWARAALTLREQSVSYREPLYLPGADQGKRSSEHQYPQAERPETRVYPNPAQNTFKLELGELPLAENLMLTLYDLNGKAVKTLAIKGQNTLVHLNELAAGVYIVAVDADTKRIFEDKLIHVD